MTYRVREHRAYGLDGAPVRFSAGHHAVREETGGGSGPQYDAPIRVVALSYEEPESEVDPGKKTSYWGWRVTRSWFDVDGARVSGPDGCAVAHELRNIRVCLDPSEQPTPDTSGVPIVVEQDPTLDRLIRLNLDADGNPTVDHAGVATMELVRVSDEVVRTCSLSLAGARVTGAQGYACLEETWDGPRELSALEPDGQRLIKARYLDADLHTTTGPGGVASWERVFGAHTVETRYFDAHGAPVAHGTHGCSSLMTSTRPDGLPLARRCDVLGDAITTSWTYDARLRLVRTSTLRDDGSPTEGPWGYAEEVFEHIEPPPGRLTTEHGSLERRTLLDAAGTSVVHPVGYASQEIERDRFRRVVEVRSFGPDGAPTAGDEGCERYRIGRDHYGDTVEARCMDASGALEDGASGHAVVTRRFDRLQREVEVMKENAP